VQNAEVIGEVGSGEHEAIVRSAAEGLGSFDEPEQLGKREPVVRLPEVGVTSLT
jgi:hypothetical protein